MNLEFVSLISLYDRETLIIALIPVILWFFFLREKAGKPFPNSLMKRYSHTPFLLMIIWLLRASIIFLVTTIILKTFLSTPISLQKNTPRDEYVIALDISKSMETDDIPPSRIEYAKSLISRHIRSLGETGLIIFAGKTFVLSPLSHDPSGVLHLIDTLTTDTINQGEKETSGTNIGDALIASAPLFHTGAKSKHIILITDGRANVGLDPLIAAENIATSTIPVSVIALGSASGSILTHMVDGKRTPLLDASGNTINGDIDIETLSKIASITHGTLSQVTPKNPTLSGESSIFGQISLLLEASETDTIKILFLFTGLFALLHALFSLILWRRYKTT